LDPRRIGHTQIPGFRWRAIHWEDRKIVIHHSEYKSVDDFEVPIHPELLEVLRDRLREEEARTGKVDPNGFVFGKPYRWIARGWK